MATCGNIGLPMHSTSASVSSMSRERVYLSISPEERERLQALAKRWSRSESNTALMLVRRGLAQLSEEVLSGQITSSDLQNLVER
jgi:hypothetical protein